MLSLRTLLAPVALLLRTAAGADDCLLNDTNIKDAVTLWTNLETRPSAEALYGHIADFNTSCVTDMTELYVATKIHQVC